ncbi:hypothetical protein ACH347_34200 [Saccharopolyspora sp. 5N102]|uniref:hypothetical protein n=1 Tax=Saccharopolyspora sp. 5N102 TaxID=3375155 RepID=UPI0037A66FD2
MAEGPHKNKITQKYVRADRDVIGYQENHYDYVTQVVLADIRVSANQPVHSAYLEHVRALAPDPLEGREEELAALTTFCTSESTAGSYLWWRAEAWSGKSALLSWFVLHPPPGVHVVSFFVTSGLPDQNNRRSFVENVVDQLHDMVDEPPPAGLTDSKREAHFRRLLTTVADRFRERGEHFTLVVDGLDEDRGVDGSADAHSIAALLPGTGVRVVVASRPLPYLPEDVRPDHPLRRSAVVERLSPSPEASAVRDTMIRDLKRLLSGSSVHQDLLGFITAADGGLSARDLAELAGTSQWQVEDDLRTAAGRSFTRRPGDPPVFVLAHDELRGLATEMLGPRLDTYRQGLHSWADTYRARQWPSDTPRYLLHGYTTTLTAIADLPRLITYVTDPRRQDLVSANHDGAALAEIKAAQALLLRQEEPDLVALARLAVHRTSLYLRNGWIPTDLPSIWAMVGQFDRAESLVAAIGDLAKRGRALRLTAEKLHRAGEQRRAAGFLDEAEDLAGAFNQWWGAWPLAELAETATRIEDYERARRAVNAIRHAAERARACASLALIAFDSARHDDAAQWFIEAEETLNETDSSIEVTVLAKVAAAASRLGHSSKAATLVDRILDDAPEHILQPTDHSKAEAAKTLADGGLPDAACTVAAMISDIEGQKNSLLDVTGAVAGWSLDEAEELARSASDGKYLSARLAAVAVAAGRNGDQSRADRLLAEIDEMLAELPQDEWRQFTIMATAVAWADAGAIERAESMVYNDMLPSEHTGGVLSVAVALARQNDVERASQLVALAEETAQSASAGIDDRRLLGWVGVMADFGDFDQAEQLVRSFPTDEVRSAGWAIIAEGLVVDGAVDRAAQTLRAITDPSLQRRPRSELLRVLLAQGEVEQAVELARSAATPQHCGEALTFVAETTRRLDLLDEVVGIADDITELEARMTILAPALRAAANLGDRRRTTELWQRLRHAATHIEQQPLNIRASLGFVPRLPDRLRTLTEIADIMDNSPQRYCSEDPRALSLNYMPPLWRAGRGLPKQVELAHDLATRHWFDTVDDLVKVEPHAFQAIVSELDRLGHRATFHPVRTRIPTTKT